MDNTNVTPEQNTPVVEKKENMFKRGWRGFKKNWKIVIGTVATGLAAAGGAYALKQKAEKDYARGKSDQYNMDLDLFAELNKPAITDSGDDCEEAE